MITRVDLSDKDDRDIVMIGLAGELEHAIRLMRRGDDLMQQVQMDRANRIMNLMTQIDGRLRPRLTP